MKRVAFTLACLVACTKLPGIEPAPSSPPASPDAGGGSACQARLRRAEGLSTFAHGSAAVGRLAGPAVAVRETPSAGTMVTVLATCADGKASVYDVPLAALTPVESGAPSDLCAHATRFGVGGEFEGQSGIARIVQAGEGPSRVVCGVLTKLPPLGGTIESDFPLYGSAVCVSATSSAKVGDRTYGNVFSVARATGPAVRFVGFGINAPEQVDVGAPEVARGGVVPAVTIAWPAAPEFPQRPSFSEPSPTLVARGLFADSTVLLRPQASTVAIVEVGPSGAVDAGRMNPFDFTDAGGELAIGEVALARFYLDGGASPYTAAFFTGGARVGPEVTGRARSLGRTLGGYVYGSDTKSIKEQVLPTAPGTVVERVAATFPAEITLATLDEFRVVLAARVTGPDGVVASSLLHTGGGGLFVLASGGAQASVASLAFPAFPPLYGLAVSASPFDHSGTAVVAFPADTSPSSWSGGACTEDVVFAVHLDGTPL